jgi:hypothetical protein
MGPVYNVVRDCAAKCDGKTDDSNALQTCINMAQKPSADSYGVVWIPPGPLCSFSKTLTITADWNQQMIIKGAFAKVKSFQPGSGLLYTGTGDGIVIRGSNGQTYSYTSGLEDVYIGAAAPAYSLIHAFGLEGPARFHNIVVDGNSLALNGMICQNCSIQVSVSHSFFYAAQDHLLRLEYGGPVLVDDVQFFDAGMDPTGTRGVGLYADAVSGLTVTRSYFELMPVGIEITNDDLQHGQYDISGNVFAVWGSGNVNSPNNTANQRCILVRSTRNDYPFYAQGSIKHNVCRVGPYFSQGASPYGMEFNTADNAYYNNTQWEIEDNSISGMTTSAIYSDSVHTSLRLMDNVATASFGPGSEKPVPVPTFSGVATPLERTQGGFNGMCPRQYVFFSNGVAVACR